MNEPKKKISKRKRRVSDHLGPNFLTDPREYQRARARWRSLVRAAIPAGRRRLWRPWVTEQKDGESAVILSCFVEKEAKGFVIVQLKPESKQEAISARMDDFGCSILKRPLDFLYISCELSAETGKIAQDLIRAWESADMDAGRMSALIQKIIKKTHKWNDRDRRP